MAQTDIHWDSRVDLDVHTRQRRTFTNTLVFQLEWISCVVSVSVVTESEDNLSNIQRKPVMPVIRLDRLEIHQCLNTLRNWALDSRETSILQRWKFDSFKSAMRFMERVGELAELHDHHPEFLSTYTQVQLRLSTHDAQGLTHKDFDLAFAIDRLVSEEFVNSVVAE